MNMTQEEKEKVNPIFKVGDLISGANSVYRIISLNDESNSYIAVTQDDEEVKIPYLFNDGQGHKCSYHFWTIKDARECDMLVCESGWACIFKGIHDRVWYSSYCFITAEGEFFPGYEMHNIYATINGNPSLATKEQRALFFKKMIEAGYYWDAKNKKVINLLQNDKI